jgi:cytochrome c oxidase subunit 4
MANTRLYTLIYVALFVLATAQVAVEVAGFVDSMYWVALGAILALSLLKAVAVAGYYQHLFYEPRSISYLIGIGLLAALSLAIAASYSIT